MLGTTSTWALRIWAILSEMRLCEAVCFLPNVPNFTSRFLQPHSTILLSNLGFWLIPSRIYNHLTTRIQTILCQKLRSRFRNRYMVVRTALRNISEREARWWTQYLHALRIVWAQCGDIGHAYIQQVTENRLEGKVEQAERWEIQELVDREKNAQADGDRMRRRLQQVWHAL